MKKYQLFLLIACVACTAAAQPVDSRASFDAIETYVQQGNAAALSAWFPDTVECNLLGEENSYSRTQATMILKDFFEKYPPAQFAFKHSSDKRTVKYAIGLLETQNNEQLRVTILLKDKGDDLKIQQLRIEKE
ncbi:MAG: DUF4783 domain-containing protein [Prevotellaceae bacterium]|nr:DUF4783 domain-containing protein [Prevotellaceae bacterium]